MTFLEQCALVALKSAMDHALSHGISDPASCADEAWAHARAMAARSDAAPYTKPAPTEAPSEVLRQRVMDQADEIEIWKRRAVQLGWKG